VKSLWDADGNQFLSLLIVRETASEREHSTLRQLSTRPINDDEMDTLDAAIRENDEFVADGLTQEMREQLEQFEVGGT
jgi:hypothetical protein